MDDHLITPEQERAIRVILEAKLETDEDYIALARLIDAAVSESVPDVDNPDPPGV